MPATQDKTRLEQLHDLRDAAFQAWSQLVEERGKVEAAFEERAAGDNKPTEAETQAHTDARATYKADVDQREAELRELDDDIRRQGEVDRRRNEAAQASRDRGPSVSITREPRTYERWKATGENGISYYRDIAVRLVDGFNLQSTSRDAAIARLDQHAREIAIEMPKRVQEREARARAQIANASILDGHGREIEGRQAAWLDRHDPFKRQTNDVQSFLVDSRDKWGNPFEFRVEPNLTQGQGGYFVPPLWLIDDFIPGLRAHLILAALVRNMDLPMGTDSINIPKLANLTVAGYQQQNNAGLPSADWSDTVVTANIKTIGGYSDVALQLLEQSPHQIVDEVVTTDLMAAYNTFLDQQVVAGDGLNASQLNGGHIQGLYPATNWSNTNTVTYTDGSPKAYNFVPGVLGPSASKVARTRFDIANYKQVLHGRRWFWYSTGLDANDRPLGETIGGGPYNIAAMLESGLQAEGLVGKLPFLSDVPVYVDNNIPITDTAGGGSGQDVAISGNMDDAWLFKGEVRMNVYREVLSGSLGVRFQAYGYNGFCVRYGQSFSVATGSGFTNPSTGFGDFF